MTTTTCGRSELESLFPGDDGLGPANPTCLARARDDDGGGNATSARAAEAEAAIAAAFPADAAARPYLWAQVRS